jgi:hypothetical protein
MLNGVNNFNNEYSNFLGVLKPKLLKNMYFLESNYNDNESIILDGLNNTSQVRVQIKSLTSTPLTTLEDGLIQLYKFQKEDFNGTNLYDHIGKIYITNALQNGATYSTTIKTIGNACLDLSQTTNAFCLTPSINFTGTTNPFTACLWIRPNPDISVYNAQDAGRFYIYSTNNNQVNFFVDSNPVETKFHGYYAAASKINGLNGATITKYGNLCNGSWFHCAFVFGNAQTLKFYCNGELVATGENKSSTLYNGNMYIGQCWNLSQLKGHVSDYRLYNRELSANEVLALYETAGIDYELKLSLEQID